MKKLYAVWALSCVMLLAACAQLGLAQPETFNQKLAVAYGTVTQTRELATTLLQQGKLSSDDASNVLATTDAARAGLDTARKLSLSQPEAAIVKLESVRSVLVAVSTYLASRQK